jgi:histidine ammonia-lyase
LRPHPGAQAVAGALRALLQGSTLVDSLPDKVQDAYSLRCAPVVLGAVFDALRYVSGVVQVEINAVTDNPLILLDEPEENKAFSAGLFHGEPVGFAADHLKLALCEVASLSERRIYRMTTGLLSSRLPPLLAGDDRPGLGLMMPQTQAAALVAANRQMAFPCSVDSLPTCEDQEDHVAMSTTAARQARAVLDNTRQVVAIELLAAWQALQIRGDAALGLGTGVFKAYLDEALPRCEAPGDTLEALMGQLDGLLAAVEATGALGEVRHG